jgi:hypothetical protein
VQGSHGAGISGFRFNGFDGPDLELTDVAVSKTLPEPLVQFAFSPGIYVDATKLTLLRVWIDQAIGMGLGTLQSSRHARSPMLSLTDLTITDTQPVGGVGILGGGLVLQSGTSTLTRAKIQGSHAVGLIAGAVRFDACDQPVFETADGGVIGDAGTCDGGAGGGASDGGTGIATFAASLTARDVTVDGTLPEQATSEYGDGLSVTDSATVDITRALLSDNARYGVIVVGATVSMDTVSVQCDTIPIGQGMNGQFNLAPGTVACQCATSSDPQQQSCRPDQGDQVQAYALPPLPAPQP